MTLQSELLVVKAEWEEVGRYQDRYQETLRESQEQVLYLLCDVFAQVSDILLLAYMMSVVVFLFMFCLFMFGHFQ